MNPQGATTYRVRTAQFGDGYSQRAKDGLNNVYDTWPLTFTGSEAEIAAIKAFLDATGGATNFYWTPPLRTQAKFIASAVVVTPLGGDNYTLTATFTEDFGP